MTCLGSVGAFWPVLAVSLSRLLNVFVILLDLTLA